MQEPSTRQGAPPGRFRRCFTTATSGALGAVALFAKTAEKVDDLIVAASQLRLFLLGDFQGQRDGLTAARVDRRHRLAEAMKREFMRLHARLDHRQRRFRARKEVLHPSAPARRF